MATNLLDVGSSIITDSLKSHIQNLYHTAATRHDLRNIAEDVLTRRQGELELCNLDKQAIEDYIHDKVIDDITDILIDENYDDTSLINLLCAKWNASSANERDWVDKFIKDLKSRYEAYYKELMPTHFKVEFEHLSRQSTAIITKIGNLSEQLSCMSQNSSLMPSTTCNNNLQMFAESIPQINIRTFSRNTIEPDCPEHLVDLSEFFDGSHLREEYSWDDTVFPALKAGTTFLKAGNKYTIVIDASFGIAFALGRLFPGKSRVNISILQSLFSGEQCIWSQGSPDGGQLDMNIISSLENEKSSDVVLALSITRNIDAAVKDYLTQQSISPNTYISCQPVNGPGFSSVRSGYHANQVAEALLAEISTILPTNRSRKIHIFCACPNALIFFFGRTSQALGSVQIYEYDMLNKQYIPTISFPNPLEA